MKKPNHKTLWAMGSILNSKIQVMVFRQPKERATTRRKAQEIAAAARTGSAAPDTCSSPQKAPITRCKSRLFGSRSDPPAQFRPKTQGFVACLVRLVDKAVW